LVNVTRYSKANSERPLHETSVNVPATRNNSVQTASLQCFGVICKICSFVDLDQIKYILK